MAGRTRSGARMLIVAITGQHPRGLPLGLVDNFSYRTPHISQEEKGIGDGLPREISYHGAGATTVSWDRGVTVPEEDYAALGIKPESRNIPNHDPIDILVFDYERHELFARVVGARPTDFSVTIGAQTTVKENCSFLAITVKGITELN